jgi:hypothetical protein
MRSGQISITPVTTKIDRNPPKPKTLPGEWVIIVLIVIFIVICIIVIYLVIVPNLFKSTSPPVNNPLLNPKGCPPSVAPVNLTATQVLFSRANIIVQWDAVLTTTTPDNTILGYNIYLSATPGITKSNTPGVYTPVVTKTMFKTSAGANLVGGVTYYYRVATVDTCGTGEISTEEISFTPTQT